jgi:DNA helicase-2/ATP-dependent DNA helicase PcrA
MVPSKFQTAIFDFIIKETLSAFVEAVAGSGKTTTIVKSLEFIPGHLRVLFLAFNKLIAEELARRVPANCDARTINSFGAQLCRQLGWRKIDTGKDAFCLADVMGIRLTEIRSLDAETRQKFYKVRNPLTRLISLYKALYPQPFDMAEVVEMYDIELPDEKICSGEEFKQLFEATLQRSINHKSLMTFDDQVFLPIWLNLQVPKYDFVFVDEAQDLNPIQIELVLRLQKAGARIIAVGDRNQAIYGFRGADVNAVDNLIKGLSATSLPLSMCYRCPKKIVQAAQEIVPQIEHLEDAIDGEIEYQETQQFIERVTDGDYVLSRVTAPLVKRCLQLIRMGRKATIRGREIGQNIKDLVEKIQESPNQPIPDFLNRLDEYCREETEKLLARDKEAQAAMLADKQQTIECFAETCKTPLEICQKIDQIFSDQDRPGIMLSTIHKAKGLQAHNIFVLRHDLLPHPMCKKPWQRQQEMNLKYVAITRAERKLVWVNKEKDER